MTLYTKVNWLKDKQIDWEDNYLLNITLGFSFGDKVYTQTIHYNQVYDGSANYEVYQFPGKDLDTEYFKLSYYVESEQISNVRFKITKEMLGEHKENHFILTRDDKYKPFPILSISFALVESYDDEDEDSSSSSSNYYPSMMFSNLPEIFPIPDGQEEEEDQKFVPETVLYQIKGTKAPIIFRVPITKNALNHGDCFILVYKNLMFLWKGKDADEKVTAMAEKCFNKLLGTVEEPHPTVLEKSTLCDEFSYYFGGVGEIQERNDIEGFERKAVRYIYKAESDDTFKKVYPYAEKSLDDNCISIIQYATSLIVYVGKKASDKVYKQRKVVLRKFLRKFNIDFSTPVDYVNGLRKTIIVDFAFNQI